MQTNFNKCKVNTSQNKKMELKCIRSVKAKRGKLNYEYAILNFYFCRKSYEPFADWFSFNHKEWAWCPVRVNDRIKR